MTKVNAGITISLDGYITGSNDGAGARLAQLHVLEVQRLVEVLEQPRLLH